MAFAPLGERHAIAEVVFAIQVSPAIDHADRANLKSGHAKWQAHLPALLDSPTVAFHVSSPGAQPPPPPLAPLDFVRYKSDGKIDWRLHIEDQSIAVNCLAYTRWQHVWTHARALFARVSEVLPETTLIASVSLQYINLFSWTGPTEDYDSRALLDESSSSVPESVLDRGPLWHLHQGWFRPHPDPPGGRILDRMHIDAIAGQDGKHLVKFENLLRFDFDGDSAARRVKPAFSTASDRLPSELDYTEVTGPQKLSAATAGSITPLIGSTAEPKESLRDQIRSLQLEAADSLAGTPPSPEAIDDALRFVDLLPVDSPTPHVSVADDGEINFFRRSRGVYMDVGFFGDGQIHYYARVEDLRIDVDGSQPFSGRSLPRDLVIPITAG